MPHSLDTKYNWNWQQKANHYKHPIHLLVETDRVNPKYVYLIHLFHLICLPFHHGNSESGFSYYP